MFEGAGRWAATRVERKGLGLFEEWGKGGGRLGWTMQAVDPWIFIAFVR